MRYRELVWIVRPFEALVEVRQFDPIRFWDYPTNIDVYVDGNFSYRVFGVGCQFVDFGIISILLVNEIVSIGN
jgi:hypothetical protein